MCELLGFSSAKTIKPANYLREFYSHCAAHPSGWGLARFDSGSMSFFAEPVRADTSPLLSDILDTVGETGTFLAHIRLATVGGLKPANCHPFIRTDSGGRVWTMIHNGTIFSGLELIRYKSSQIGETDSERILMYLIDRIDAERDRLGREPNGYERFKIAEQVTQELSYRNKLNLIIFDGEQMYVHVNMRGTLHIKEDDSGAMFSTVPLDDTGWKPLQLTTLHVYENGKLKFKGKNHRNEYQDPISAAIQKLEYSI